jgi:Lon-like protease
MTDNLLPPETGEAAPPPAPAARAPVSLWVKLLIGVSVLAVVVGIAGTVIRLPYDTLAPGAALKVGPLVTVHGAKTFPHGGDVMLLFVRERDHINVWSWLQAKLDSNIDMFKPPEDQKGGVPEKHPDEQGVCDMTQSKVAARVAALEALGYKVKTAPGVDVSGFPRGEKKGGGTLTFPAEDVLFPCDEIVAIDGHAIASQADVKKRIESHRVGTNVTLRIIRDGHPLTVKVPVTEYNGNRIIGIAAAPRFALPITVDVDTSSITGPSAGLAMTLAIIDALTPGSLTGGKRVAVTGTISPDGSVGEIGGIRQKAIAANASHAQIFIVPACVDDPQCKQDLKAVKARVGKHVEVVPVGTLAQALRVLRAAGGAPVKTQTPSSSPAS